MKIASAIAHQAVIVKNVRMLRIERQSLLIIPARLIKLSRLGIGCAARIPGLRKLRIEFDGFRQVINSQRPFSHLEIGITAIVPGLAVTAVQGQRSAKIAYGCFQQAQRVIGDTPVVIGQRLNAVLALSPLP